MLYTVIIIMNMDIEISPLRGGSTTSIPCPANTSDPMMLVSGSFERGDMYLSNKKKFEEKILTELREILISVNGSGFSCLNLIWFQWRSSCQLKAKIKVRLTEIKISRSSVNIFPSIFFCWKDTYFLFPMSR